MARVDAKLTADTYIRSTNIDIKVIQGNVVLLGIVRSGEEIAKATAHAKSVGGVRNVTSFLMLDVITLMRDQSFDLKYKSRVMTGAAIILLPEFNDYRWNYCMCWHDRETDI